MYAAILHSGNLQITSYSDVCGTWKTAKNIRVGCENEKQLRCRQENFYWLVEHECKKGFSHVSFTADRCIPTESQMKLEPDWEAPFITKKLIQIKYVFQMPNSCVTHTLCFLHLVFWDLVTIRTACVTYQLWWPGDPSLCRHLQDKLRLHVLEDLWV